MEGQLLRGGKAPTSPAWGPFRGPDSTRSLTQELPTQSLGHCYCPPNPVRFCETSGNQRSAIQPDPGMASPSNSRLRECESAQRPSGISMEKMIIAVPMEDEVL